MIQPSHVIQALPCYHERDAIGTHTKNIGKLLNESGYQTDLFVELFPGHNGTKPIATIKDSVDQDSIVIYHHSTGSRIPTYLQQLECFKIICYHNITPAYFFNEPEEQIIRGACQRGRLQMGFLSHLAQDSWADSRYNANELTACGFKNTKVLPILRDYESLARLPSHKQTLETFGSNKKNILFVGRIVPNKAFHDLIMTTKAYMEHIDRNVRLILVGSPSQAYQRKLDQLCHDLNLSIGYSLSDKNCDVYFLGSQPSEVLASCYRQADLFLCLSDHEGYCVPLIEAMAFGLPIIAHRSSVIPETCGDAAILIEKHNLPELIAAMKHVLVARGDTDLRQLSSQRAQLFKWERLKTVFGQIFQASLDSYQIYQTMR